MSDATLLYWGILVTAFLAIAALITARDLVEKRLEAKGYAVDEDDELPTLRSGAEKS